MDLPSLVAIPALAYLVVAAFVALDALIPAMPGEIFVISGGALAATGHLQVGWVVAASAAGAIVGDLLLYAISRRALPGTLDRSRLGRRIRARISRAHETMGSTSVFAVVAARFIPFGRTTVAAAASLTSMRPSRFAALSLAGCTAWAVWTTGLGFVTGNVAGSPLWLSVLLGVAIGVVVGIWAGALRVIARTHRRLSSRAVTTAADEPDPSPTSELVG